MNASVKKLMPSLIKPESENTRAIVDKTGLDAIN